LKQSKSVSNHCKSINAPSFSFGLQNTTITKRIISLLPSGIKCNAIAAAIPGVIFPVQMIVGSMGNQQPVGTDLQ
jgi:hypothetical protein